MSGEKQKVSPLTEPAQKPSIPKQMPTYAVHWVKKSIWMSTTLWR